MIFNPNHEPSRNPNEDGRLQDLRALWATIRPVFCARWESLVGMAGTLTGIASAGSAHARRALSHSFETRIGVAAVLVLVSAVFSSMVGYELGGRMIAAGPEAASEALDDALAHAGHAFDLGAPEAIDLKAMDLEAGELIAQYAPVSIDALPVHERSPAKSPPPTPSRRSEWSRPIPTSSRS